MTWLSARITMPRDFSCVPQQLAQMRTSRGATHRQGCAPTSGGCNASGGRFVGQRRLDMAWCTCHDAQKLPMCAAAVGTDAH